MDIVRVQHWVMSVLLLTTAMLFAGGLAVLSLYVDDRGSARVGLRVVAGIVGVVAVVGVRFINEKPWLTWWLLLGLIPFSVASYVAIWR